MPNFFEQFHPEQAPPSDASQAQPNFFTQFHAPQELEAEKEKNPLWYDAITAFPGSAAQLIWDSATGAAKLLMNPVGVGRDIARVGVGNIASEMVRPYTSLDELEKTVRTDPARIIADVSGVASLGGLGARAAAATGRVPTMVGKVGSAMEAAGVATDPTVMALKVGATTAKQGKNMVHGLVGGTTGAHGPAIAEAAQRGYEASYGGVAQKAARGIEAVLGKNAVTDAIHSSGDPRAAKVYLGHKSGKQIIDYKAVGQDMTRVAKDEALRKYRADLDADFQKVGNQIDWQPIGNMIQQARKSPGAVYSSGTPKLGNKFWKEADQLYREYVDAAVPQWLRNDRRSVKALANLKSKPDPWSDTQWSEFKKMQPTLKKQVTELQNVDSFPGTLSTKKFVENVFPQYRGTAAAMDDFRRELRNRGMKISFKSKDNAAKALASELNNKIIDEMDVQFKRAGAGSPRQRIEQFDNDMSGIGEWENTFSIKSKGDSLTRKISSILRDNVFTNYGERRATLQKMIDVVKESNISPDRPAAQAPYLTAAAAGDATHSYWRPNMWSMMAGGAAPAGLGVVVTGNPAWAAAAIPGLMMHSPRVMGSAAFRAGRIQGLFVKPLKASAKFLGDVQRKYLNGQVVATGRGALRSAGQINRLMDSWEQNRNVELVKELEARSVAAGYNINKRTFERLATQINSGDADQFMKAMETIGRNDRLMRLFEGKIPDRGK